MATAPAKPQPLHNFPLSLKWGQTTTVTTASSAANNHHQHQRSSRRSPTLPPDSETESEPEPTIQHAGPLPHPLRVGSRSARLQRYSFSSCSNLLQKPKRPSPPTERSEKQTGLESDVAGKQKKQLGNNSEPEGEEEEEKEKQEEEEGNSRPWKLRPRKGGLGGKNGGELKEAAAMQVNEQREKEIMHPKSMRLRGLAESGGGTSAGGCLEKKEKRKVWISLSREEIEEDIFVLTGSRPARRPRKRPKNVQKVLDSVFPGLWLVGVTADSYRVADTPVKR